MKQNIILLARYGYKHCLKNVKDNLWTLECDPKSSGYYRIIGSPDNIHAIDPDGGPFLSVGDQVSNYHIKSITADGLIELE
jgi:hypothetical protein